MTTILWRPEEWMGTEYATVRKMRAGYRAEGHTSVLYGGLPVYASYLVDVDARWQLPRVRAAWSTRGSTHRARLRRDATGAWFDVRVARPDLDGCDDVDIAWTPMTNTLPIRRLALEVGQQREILVAYLEPPDLRARPERQRYTRLAADRWRFEAVPSGYTADLTVDADGRVTDYPGLFRAAGMWTDGKS